jgi:uncharacterized protein (TIGR00255 family)
MTAFARAQREGNWGHLVCEMRSINHRYLEISLHLPEVLRVFDMALRERIRQKIKRGKIECAVRFQHANDSAGAMLSIDEAYAKELCGAAEKISHFLKKPAEINPADILRFSGVLESQEANLEQLEKELFSLVDQAIEELVSARAREGEELKQLFLQRMDAMEKEVSKVRKELPGIMTAQREKMLKRFNDVKLDLDPARLEQEMVMFAHKIDVAEELERTETHIGEVRRVLKHGGPVGRRMDFLLQELNREANTLGSKSTDTVITHTAIEMKVLIEQVREQVQNVE